MARLGLFDVRLLQRARVHFRVVRQVAQLDRVRILFAFVVGDVIQIDADRRVEVRQSCDCGKLRLINQRGHQTTGNGSTFVILCLQRHECRPAFRNERQQVFGVDRVMNLAVLEHQLGRLA